VEEDEQHRAKADSLCSASADVNTLEAHVLDEAVHERWKLNYEGEARVSGKANERVSLSGSRKVEGDVGSLAVGREYERSLTERM
jgi:hypothetical protein